VIKSNLENPRIVTRTEWLAARKELLAREKELTRARDAVSAERRGLPWVRVEKEYVFDTPEGKKTLADLFDGRSQLIVYHFMWRRDMDDRCVGCSFLADHIDGANQHLAHHDVSLVVCSRASVSELKAYKKRMGWRFNWVSSYANDFNYDYHVSFTPEEVAGGKAVYNFETSDVGIDELPGVSVFAKDKAGTVYHTYSAYARGDERGIGAYMFLDLAPKGRNENGPNYNLTDWVRRHDTYETDGRTVAKAAARG